MDKLTIVNGKTLLTWFKNDELRCFAGWPKEVQEIANSKLLGVRPFLAMDRKGNWSKNRVSMAQCKPGCVLKLWDKHEWLKIDASTAIAYEAGVALAKVFEKYKLTLSASNSEVSIVTSAIEHRHTIVIDISCDHQDIEEDDILEEVKRLEELLQ